MPNSMELHCGCFTARCAKQDGWMRGDPHLAAAHPSIHSLLVPASHWGTKPSSFMDKPSFASHRMARKSQKSQQKTANFLSWWLLAHFKQKIISLTCCFVIAMTGKKSRKGKTSLSQTGCSDRTAVVNKETSTTCHLNRQQEKRTARFMIWRKKKLFYFHSQMH